MNAISEKGKGFYEIGSTLWIYIGNVKCSFSSYLLDKRKSGIFVFWDEERNVFGSTFITVMFMFISRV